MSLPFPADLHSGVVSPMSHPPFSAVQPSTATSSISIHDIMDHPWPSDLASKKEFAKALAEALQSQRVKAMSVKEVSSWWFFMVQCRGIACASACSCSNLVPGVAADACHTELCSSDQTLSPLLSRT